MLYKYLIFIIIIIILFLKFFDLILNSKRNVIIDAFTYYQESFMLSIRLSRMNRFVDYFVIVTSNATYSGLPLTISFYPFESYIQKYKHKIIFYNFSFPANLTKPRKRENYQRIVISDAIKSLKINKDSTVLISDLDEIPTSDAMKYIIKNPPKKLYILNGFMYYYNYRHKLKTNWPGVIVLKSLYCDNNIQILRNNRNSLYYNYSIPIFPSLTHCSYCYKSISSIQKKLQSFAHTEYNKPPYTNSDYIIYSIKNHIDIFKKNTLEVVKYDEQLLPLPNDFRFNYLKDEFGLI